MREEFISKLVEIAAKIKDRLVDDNDMNQTSLPLTGLYWDMNVYDRVYFFVACCKEFNISPAARDLEKYGFISIDKIADYLCQNLD